jgi:sialic acid synthase SpsE
MDGASSPLPPFMAAGKAWTARNPLIIAEIGTAHGADPEKARELVIAAKESGADCAKFQHVYADEIIHPRTGAVPLPGGEIRLYDRFKALESSVGFFRDIKDYAESLGLIFLCTPFGARSAKELISLGPALLKAASPELNHFPLLAELGSSSIPLILSTGVSRLADIDEALAAIGYPEARSAPSLLLLHCVTAYPAPPGDYNLRAMANVGAVFGLPVGVSDHSLDPLLVPLLALAMGACAVEKHFTLSKDGGGLDDPVALTPPEFSRMASALRGAARGTSGEILSGARREFGEKAVEDVLGDGVKRLAKAEAENYGRTNRSIHATRAIRSGEIFDPASVAILRTEKILRPGLSPRHIGLVLGRTAARDVPDGEGIEWDDLGERVERKTLSGA